MIGPTMWSDPVKFVEFGAQHRETVMPLHGGGLFLGGQILAEMLAQRLDICRFALLKKPILTD